MIAYELEELGAFPNGLTRAEQNYAASTILRVTPSLLHANLLLLDCRLQRSATPGRLLPGYGGEQMLRRVYSQRTPARATRHRTARAGLGGRLSPSRLEWWTGPTERGFERDSRRRLCCGGLEHI